VPVGICSAAAAQTWFDDDWWVFHAAARLGSHAYAADYTPLTGPATLVLAWLLPYWAAVALTVALLPVLIARNVPEPSWLTVGSLVAPAWGIAATWGHLDDALAAVLLLEARHQQGWRRGACVGLAVVFKPWAIIGLPLLLIPRRDVWLGVAVPQVLWLPFLPGLVDGEYFPGATLGSITSGLFGAWNQVPEWWRIAQLTLITTVALAVAWSGRYEAFMLVAFAVRVVTDAGDFVYYGAAFMAFALPLPPRQRNPALALIAVLTFGPWLFRFLWMNDGVEPAIPLLPALCAGLCTAVIGVALHQPDELDQLPVPRDERIVAEGR
jgi:hypothetical protein